MPISSVMFFCLLCVGWKNKSNYSFLFLISKEIKNASMSFLKSMLSLIVSLIMNHFSYIYFSVGLSMNYGGALLSSLFMTFSVWLTSTPNKTMMLLGHLLPLGAGGSLKIPIPLIEMLGIFIRPITLAARSATNISCGHAVSPMSSHSFMSMSLLMTFSVGGSSTTLFFTESLVCLIQAYVFRSPIYTHILEVEIQSARKMLALQAQGS